MRTLTTAPTRGMMGAIAVLALAGTACAPDGSDAHLAAGVESEAAEPDEEPAEESDTDATSGESMESGESTEMDEAAAETVPPNGEVVTVLAIDNSFIDEVVEVEAGTEILWTNNGRNDHDVIPVDPTQEWGIEIEDFPPGAEYSYVFGAPGEYAYFCTIHGTETVGMTGTIIVTG